MNEPGGGSITEQELNNFLGEARRAWLHDLVRNGMNDRPSPREVTAKMNAVEQPAPPPEFGWEAASLQPRVLPAEGPQVLEVYFSAGPVYGTMSCDADNSQNCVLYKVRWDLVSWTGTATKVLDIRLIGGVEQPTVELNGRRLAVVVSSGDNGLGMADEVALLTVRKSLSGSATYTFDPWFESASYLRPAKPAWWGPNRLLWARNVHGSGTWWGNLHMTTWTGSSHRDEVLLGDPDGTPAYGGAPACTAASSVDDPNCISWRDPDVIEQPAFAGGALSWVTVFGRHGDPQGSSMPIVARLPHGDAISRFEGGVGADGEAITDCHHSAFNVSGDRVLCTRQEPLDGPQSANPSLPKPKNVRALYQFRYSGGRWINAGELVQPEDVAAWPAFGSAANYELLTYKYGHWCGSDRYVVATVFVTDNSLVQASRVILFDTERPDTFADLTDVVEAHAGARAGSWRAQHSTCPRVAS